MQLNLVKDNYLCEEIKIKKMLEFMILILCAVSIIAVVIIFDCRLTIDDLRRQLISYRLERREMRLQDALDLLESEGFTYYREVKNDVIL